jgi:2-haloacid dehalogenase
MIRGVLLDFYGTVVHEDDEAVADIIAQIGGAAGLPPGSVGTAWWRLFQEEMAGPFRPQRDIAVSSLSRTLRHFGSGLDAATLCGPQLAYWGRPHLYDDSRDVLAALDVPVCVLSNIDRVDVVAAIAHHGLPLPIVVTSDDVGAYKPSPAMFAAGLDRIGLRPDEVLHVGDSLSADVAGARAAGIAAAWVNRAGKARPDPFTAVAEVPDLRSILPLIR